jgi:N-acetylglucosaminyldiphosphoundecaprenol N-acetyl-beta-D-mannosaminyltransferase
MPQVPVQTQAQTTAPDAEFASVDFLGLRFRDIALHEAASMLVRDAEHGVRRIVFFINAHCCNIAATDKNYADALRQADLLFADGFGVALAARMWGQRLRDNINGTDLFPLLCELAAARGVPIALLGAKPGVAEQCAARMSARYTGLRVVFTRDGYADAANPERTIASINRSGARILLVAKGVPLQELWITQHAEAINLPILMGVGALFDFYSGRIRRAPIALRRLKLEWLFRLSLEPRRLFTRYILGNPLFVYRALKMRLMDNETPSTTAARDQKGSPPNA